VEDRHNWQSRLSVGPARGTTQQLAVVLASSTLALCDILHPQRLCRVDPHPLPGVCLYSYDTEHLFAN
jgi:hypothetical protein